MRPTSTLLWFLLICRHPLPPLASPGRDDRPLQLAYRSSFAERVPSSAISSFPSSPSFKEHVLVGTSWCSPACQNLRVWCVTHAPLVDPHLVSDIPSFSSPQTVFTCTSCTLPHSPVVPPSRHRVRGPVCAVRPLSYARCSLFDVQPPLLLLWTAGRFEKKRRGRSSLAPLFLVPPWPRRPAPVFSWFVVCVRRPPTSSRKSSDGRSSSPCSPVRPALSLVPFPPCSKCRAEVAPAVVHRLSCV